MVTSVFGARYTPPSGLTLRAVARPAGTLSFAKGPVQPPVSLNVQLGTDERFRNEALTPLPFVVQPGSGLVTGYFLNTSLFGQSDLKFTALMIQKTNVMAGFFTGTYFNVPTSGRVFYGP